MRRRIPESTLLHPFILVIAVIFCVALKVSARTGHELLGREDPPGVEIARAYGGNGGCGGAGTKVVLPREGTLNNCIKVPPSRSVMFTGQAGHCKTRTVKAGAICGTVIAANVPVGQCVPGPADNLIRGVECY